MAGLRLNTGFSASGVVAASPPSQSGRTITQQAYGISSGADMGGRTAGWGSTLIGIGAAAVLVYLWWSLPR